MEPAAQNSAAAAAIRLIRRFGAPYGRWFRRGAVATVFVVAARLAMPWPLRGILEIVSNVPPFGVVDWVPVALALVGVYVAIAALLGYVELTQRVSFKAFAARTVHDMREFAVVELRQTEQKRRLPELLSRIIGDTARIKAEMSGILVHVSQNGLLFVGVVVMFLFLVPKLSVFFLLGGLFAIVAGYRATSRISAVTRVQREKESEYALFVDDYLENGSASKPRYEANSASAREDVSATRLIARSAWINHVALSAITGVALLVAIWEAQHGRVTLGEVFLFIAYVLTVHRRMIQVGRQLARAGKLIANVSRIGELIDPEVDFPGGKSTVHGAPAEVPRRTPLDPKIDPDLAVKPRGTTTLLLSQQGKPALFPDASRSLGERAALWGLLHLQGNLSSESSDIALVAAEPYLGRHRIRHFVPTLAHLETKEAAQLGLPKLIQQLPEGLKTRVSDLTLGCHEARALSLGRLLWGDPESSIWLIEDPFSGLPPRSARRLMKFFQRTAETRTIVLSVACSDGLELGWFDRLVVLVDNKVAFEGKPSDWRLNAAFDSCSGVMPEDLANGADSSSEILKMRSH
jgi:ATP-binding cassette, subfamily B, bacterial